MVQIYTEGLNARAVYREIQCMGNASVEVAPDQSVIVNTISKATDSTLLCLCQMVGCLTCLVIVPAQVASNHGFVPRQQVLQQKQRLYQSCSS